MLTLHLVRHGQTNFNAERRVQGQHDSVLDDVGIAQAEELRSSIEALAPSAVYSSSNVRAKHTADILTANMPIEVECLDSLREIYMGPWQERLWHDVAETETIQFTNFMGQPNRFSIEGAETFAELQTRGVGAIEEIISCECAKLSSGSTTNALEVLIVSHGAILKTIMAHYANVPIAHMWTEPHLENCSHSTLHIDAEGNRRLRTICGESVRGTIWDS